MEPTITIIDQKKLIGISSLMSITDNRVRELWQRFMPRLSEIQSRTSPNLISMAVYSEGHFTQFNPTATFEKWAGVEVLDSSYIPTGMEAMVIPKGEYAVFQYKGLSTDHSIFRYIFSEWLPKSNYNLDTRPHFEILGSNYKNNDPNSEEEIWIPVREKQ